MEMKINSISLHILVLTVVAAATLLEAETRYRFPSHCQCQYMNMRGGANCSNPTCFPNNRELDLEGDCLPPVPENHRLCFRMRVTDCSGKFHCSLFKGGLGMARLPMTSNPNTVNIKSVKGTGRKTVCFYNVSLSNCSQVILRHVTDHPEEEYLDKIGDGSGVDPACRNDFSSCKDYLRFYYNGQRTKAYCRDELAHLELPLIVGSFLAVHWADDVVTNPLGSFEVQVECTPDNLLN